MRAPRAVAPLPRRSALAALRRRRRAAAPSPTASTLDATLVDRDGDGALARGPGEPLLDRTELAPRGRPGAVLATLAQLTDTHVRDEESPARVPFLDRLGGAVHLDVPPAGGAQHAGARGGRARGQPRSSPTRSS